MSDVRQHLKRKHPEEAKRVESDRGRKKKPMVELWNDIWGDLFPNQALPATPYVGTGDGDLVGAWITEYIARGGDEVPDVGLRVLMGLLAYVNASSRDNGPGSMSGEVHVSEQASQGIQAHTRQHHPLPMSSYGPIMDSFELLDQRFVPTGVSGVPILGAATEPQVSSNVGAIGQHWALLNNSDAFPSTAPIHQFGTAPQLPPDGWMDMGFANGYVNAQTAQVDPTGVVYGAWMGNH